MKKLIYTVLIFLSASGLFAQQQMELKNQTDCTLEYVFNSFDNNCGNLVTTFYTVGPSSSLLVTAPGGRYFHYVEISESPSYCLGVALQAPASLAGCVRCYTPLPNVRSSEIVNTDCTCQDTFTLDWIITSCQFGEVVVK